MSFSPTSNPKNPRTKPKTKPKTNTWINLDNLAKERKCFRYPQQHWFCWSSHYLFFFLLFLVPCSIWANIFFPSCFSLFLVQSRFVPCSIEQLFMCASGHWRNLRPIEKRRSGLEKMKNKKKKETHVFCFGFILRNSSLIDSSFMWIKNFTSACQNIELKSRRLKLLQWIKRLEMLVF